MAFARIEPVVSECRLFYEDNPGPDAPYIGSLLIRYRALERGAVDICMYTSTQQQTRATMRALLSGLLAAGITRVYAHRRLGHRMPGAKVSADDPDVWITDLASLVGRL